MRTFLAFAGIVMVLAVYAAAADAAIVPLAVKETTPANGATIVAAPLSVTLTLQLKTDVDPSDNPVWLEVATAPTPGQDGTLASEFQIGFTSLTRGDAFPDTYTANVILSQPLEPGKRYYWQAYFSKIDYVDDGSPYPMSQLNMYESPVYSFTVQAPAPPPTPAPTPGQPPMQRPHRAPYLSKAGALNESRDVIRAESGHRPYNLHHRCGRRARNKVRCNLNWRTTRHPHARTWIYAGTMNIQTTRMGTERFGFNGLRARLSCLAHKSVKRCSRRVRW